MKKGQTSKRGCYQDVLFPMEYMNVTQGNNGQFSHMGVNALDLAGKDTGRDLFYAPFDVKCVATGDRNTEGNAAFWESTQKVRFADGTIDYATIMVLHDNSLSGIYPGVRYTQGTQIGQEGTAGFATGNHNHFEIAKGKFNHKYDQNKFGVFHLPKSISADKACFVDNTTILNGNGMKWKKLADVKVSTASKPSPTPSKPSKEKVDQILHVGSHCKYTKNTMTVTDYDQPSGCVFLKEIDAWAWPKHLTKKGKNQILYLKDKCYFTKNYFTVTKYDSASGDVYLKEADMWAHPKDLTEVA